MSFRLNKKKLFVLVAGLACAAAFFLLTRPAEPSFEGKTLTQWLPSFGKAWMSTHLYAESPEAQRAIRGMGTNVMPFLLQQLCVHDSNLKRKLMAFSKKYSPVQLQWTRDADTYHQSRCALDALDLRKSPLLLDLLRDKRPQVRSFAANALGKYGPDSAFALPELIIALSDSETAVRSRAAGALGAIGVAARPSVPALLKAVQSTNEDDRVSAVRALTTIGVDSHDTVEVLVKALHDPNSLIRRDAASSLGTAGNAATGAISPLTNALQDGDEEVRHAAATALEAITRSVTPDCLSPPKTLIPALSA
jgi:hypothetical protein